VVPSATAPAVQGAATVPVAPAAATARELVVVSTDVLKLTFDSEGGSLVRTEFVKYKDMQDKNRNFVLLDESKERVYVAQTGLIGGSAGAVFPTHKTPMKVVGARDLQGRRKRTGAEFRVARCGRRQAGQDLYPASWCL
jgi:YidC/Oxa1 family membrane protein insertase